MFVLLEMAEEAHGLGLAEATREAVVAATTNTHPVADRPGPAAAAITLRASLTQTGTLTPGEQHLLGKLVDRSAS